MFAPPLRAEWLPLLEADVLVLIDELLVPDENDEPSEIIELGRRVDFTSGRVPEKEFLNLGAVKQFRLSSLVRPRYELTLF